MKIKPILENLKSDIVLSSFRFTLSLVILFTLCVIGSINIEAFSEQNVKIFIVGAPVLLLSVASYSFVEMKKLPRYYGHIGGVICILIGILFYLILPDDIDNPKHYWIGILIVCLSIILMLILSIIPFFKTLIGFLEYNATIFFNIWSSLLLSIIMFASVSFFVLALENLFLININFHIYEHLGLWSFVFLGFWRLISEIPVLPYNHSNFNHSKATQFIVTYLCIPITTVYGVIAYVYIITSVVSGSSTITWINSFILWFISIGFVTFLLNKVLTKNKLINTLFNKFWLYFILPIGIYFIANLFINIHRDGLDEGYYFLILSGVLLLATTGYLIFINNQNLRVISIVGIGLLVFAIIPSPWNAWNITTSAQKSRLVNDLMSKGVIVDNAIIIRQVETKLDNQTVVVLNNLEKKEALNFLKKFDVKNVLPEPINEQILYDKLNLKEDNIYRNKNTFSYNYPDKTINIQGFDQILPISNYKGEIKGSRIEIDNQKLYLVNGMSRYLIDINETDILHDTFIRSLPNYEIKFFIREISGIKTSEEIKIDFLRGYALFREK